MQFGGPSLGPTGLNEVQYKVFCYFIEFGSYALLEVAYSDSFQQCLTSSRDNDPKRKLGEGTDLGQTGQNWARN